METAQSSLVPQPANEEMNQSFVQSYGDLRLLARSRLRRTRRDTLLNTTSLVHEFYIRMAESGGNAAEWSAFLQHAARVMRNIVIDGARRRKAVRHGGAYQKASIDDAALPAIARDDEVLAVHEALDRLEAVKPRLVRIVEMSYFGGMTEREIAEALQLSERTVRRELQKATLLLASSIA